MDNSLRHPLVAVSLAVAFSLLPSSLGYAQSKSHESGIVINVTVLPQDSPVRILGMRLPASNSSRRGPLVHVLNTSSTKAAEVWVDVVMWGQFNEVGRTASSDDPVPDAHFREQFWDAQPIIQPGTDAWFRDRQLEPDHFVTIAKRMGSNCISVGVQVKKVDFEDGTTWSAPPIDSSVLKSVDKPGACRSATATQDELGNVTGYGMIISNSAQNLSSEVQSYSIVCTLRDEDVRIVSTCPF
jgi:hypothetical protein